jgi:heptose I phosphotransferase
MNMELWLNEEFAALWAGQDVFAAAFALDGDVRRALEQRQTLAFSANGRRYFIKRHRGVSWTEIFKNLLTLRLPVVSARNEYRALRKLAELGVAVPRVAAYGRRGFWPPTLESCLVTEDVGHHQSLEDYCRHWHTRAPAFVEKAALVNRIADISRILHTNGICHRDYYLCHFLRAADGTLTVIDLHRALTKRKLGRRWIVKDLAGLYFSALDAGLTRRDLLRFVRRYRGGDLRAVLAREANFWTAVSRRAKRLYRK